MRVSQPISASGAVAELRGVHKRFGNLEALNRPDLQVKRGELLALLGPNGAGKSTAISLLLGLQEPTSGQALLFGESPPLARRHADSAHARVCRSNGRVARAAVSMMLSLIVITILISMA